MGNNINMLNYSCDFEDLNNSVFNKIVSVWVTL